MIKTIIKFLCLILLLTPSMCLADWANNPVSINGNKTLGNVHYNSGGRRIVRVGTTVIALAIDNYNEEIWRKVGTGAWAEIDTDTSVYSGSLIRGKDDYVYHFFQSADHIYMTKFLYSATPGAPVSIYTTINLSESSMGDGYDKTVNATVDSEGNLYVFTHWDDDADGTTDHFYCLYSTDEGSSWNGPYQITTVGSVWHYPHGEVTTNDRLVFTGAVGGSGDQPIMFAYSDDKGETWTVSDVSNEETYNPSILTDGTSTVYLFAQSTEATHTGLVYNKSTNSGTAWNGWVSIETTCGYADPSPALGSDGNIYVAYRSNVGSGITEGSCGEQSKSKLAMSDDEGATWSFPDGYVAGERSGTRSQLRYQTWFNGGGQLDWIWVQYTDSGVYKPTYFDTNEDVIIKSAGAPSIYSVTGTVNNGETIVISGSDFNTGASPLIWDNFESGSDGNDITGWNLPDADNHPVYSNYNNRTNSTLNAYSNNGTDDLEYVHGGTLSTVYVTFWMRTTRSIIDDTYNNKWCKIWYDGIDFYPEITLITQWSGPGTQCNAATQVPDYVFTDSITNPTVSTWERFEIYAEESTSPTGTFDGTADGNIYVWQQSGGEGNTFALVTEQENIITNNSGSTRHWERVCLMEYNRSAGGATITEIDDVYISSSMARVEIGDNAVWASCTHREVQIPTAWATGEITIAVNQGSFSDGTAYLFIIDSDGVASNGYEITISNGNHNTIIGMGIPCNVNVGVNLIIN